MLECISHLKRVPPFALLLPATSFLPPSQQTPLNHVSSLLCALSASPFQPYFLFLSEVTGDLNGAEPSVVLAPWLP